MATRIIPENRSKIRITLRLSDEVSVAVEQRHHERDPEVVLLIAGTRAHGRQARAVASEHLEPGEYDHESTRGAERLETHMKQLEDARSAHG
jgi:hypothetical protein